MQSSFRMQSDVVVFIVCLTLHRCYFNDTAVEFISSEYVKTDSHEVVAGINAVIAVERRRCIRHHIDFTDLVLAVGIKTLQTHMVTFVAETRIDVECKYYSFLFVFAYEHG